MEYTRLSGAESSEAQAKSAAKRAITKQERRSTPICATITQRRASAPARPVSAYTKTRTPGSRHAHIDGGDGATHVHAIDVVLEPVRGDLLVKNRVAGIGGNFSTKNSRRHRPAINTTRGSRKLASSMPASYNRADGIAQTTQPSLMYICLPCRQVER